MSKSNPKFRAVKKTVKKVGRGLTAGLLTAAAVGSLLPYKIEKKQNTATGDGDLVATSLLLRTSLTPKREDSVTDKTLLSVKLRPVKEICGDLRRAEQLLPKKKSANGKAPAEKKPAGSTVPTDRKTAPTAAPKPEQALRKPDESKVTEAKAVLKEEKALLKARKKVHKLEQKVVKKRLKRAKHMAKRKHS